MLKLVQRESKRKKYKCMLYVNKYGRVEQIVDTKLSINNVVKIIK